MTANPERGEVDLVVGGKTYVLALTTNTICSLEKRTGKPYGELLAGLARFQHEALRDLLWSALERHHKAQFKTLESVGDLIDDAGGFASFLSKFRDLAGLNRRPETEDKDGENANPPEAGSAGGSLRLTLAESA